MRRSTFASLVAVGLLASAPMVRADVSDQDNLDIEVPAPILASASVSVDAGFSTPADVILSGSPTSNPGTADVILPEPSDAAVLVLLVSLGLMFRRTRTA